MFIRSIILGAFLTLFIACSVPEESEAIPSEPTGSINAITGVSILTSDGTEFLAGQTVLVEGERITQVGPASEVNIPEGANTIEGAGRYLIPGFAEMHGHIPSPESSPEYIEDVLFLYAAHGVTTVRGMLGHPNQLNLRARANSGELISPTLYLAGPGFRGNVIESPEHAAEMVRQQHDEGWDLLKVYPGLTVEEYDAMADTAHEVGIPFAGHVPAEVGLAHALEKGQRTIDHLDGYIEYLNGDQGPLDEARLEEVVQLTLDSGAAVVPTMALWETILGAADFETLQNYPELRYMPKDIVESWTESYQKRISAPDFNRERASQIAENRKVLLRALAEGGVTILFGTDAPQQYSVPGYSIFREAEHMADCGLSTAEILVSGTVNVGEYFQDKDTFGQIAEGHRADLILLTANPLEDISNLSEQAGVMVRGRWLSREEIDNRLSDLAARHAAE